ncbi:MAG: hypothetical protein ABIG11_02750 [bacterium]
MKKIMMAVMAVILANGTVFAGAMDDLQGITEMEIKDISIIQAPVPEAVPQTMAKEFTSGSFTLRIGDKVITRDDDTGKVAGITPDGKISVRNDDGTYNLWKPNQLAKRKGCSMGLCVGNRIVTQFGGGKVSGVYSNGWLAVRDDDPRMGYTTCTDENDIAKMEGCLSGYCVGDTVIGDAVPGTIAGIFPDGRFSVRFYDDSYHIYSSKHFAQTGKKDCTSSGFCVGDTVVAENGNYYTIAGVFSNGRLSILSHQYHNYYDSGTSGLAKTGGCSGGFCVGEKIITTRRHSGRIAGIFSDGEVLFYRDDYKEGTVGYCGDPDYFRIETRLLAKTIGCSGGFCAGSEVIIKEGAGKVAGIFSKDDELSIRVDGEYYNVYPGQIAKTEGCSGGFCAGDTVINKTDGYTGTVAGIFSDGMLSVEVKGRHFFSKPRHYLCTADELTRSISATYVKK